MCRTPKVKIPVIYLVKRIVGFSVGPVSYENFFDPTEVLGAKTASFDNNQLFVLLFFAAFPLVGGIVDSYRSYNSHYAVSTTVTGIVQGMSRTYFCT